MGVGSSPHELKKRSTRTAQHPSGAGECSSNRRYGISEVYHLSCKLMCNFASAIEMGRIKEEKKIFYIQDN